MKLDTLPRGKLSKRCILIGALRFSSFFKGADARTLVIASQKDEGVISHHNVICHRFAVARMGYLVGIQIGITSGIAVWKDSDLLFAASEERYSRIKNDTAFPVQAASAAIKKLGLNKSNIEQVLLVSQNMSPVHFLCKRECSFSVEDYIREQEEYYYPRLIKNEDISFLDLFSDFICNDHPDLLELLRGKSEDQMSIVWNKWRIDFASRIFGVDKSIISIENHERAHACYGYYGSPFRGDDVLIVTMDGFGDTANATVSIDKGEGIRLLQKYSNFNVGRIYRYITLLLCMKPSEHEFKVMGLAPYATEYNYTKALNVFREAYSFDKATGELRVSPDLQDNYFYFKERLKSCRFDGIAGALQVFVEELIKSLVSFWLSKTGASRVVISGGVSLNIKANMEVSKLESVTKTFVVGSGGDESLCVGSIYSYLDRNGRCGEIKPISSLYLGDELDSRSVSLLVDDSCSKEFKITRNCSNNYLAQFLADGKILGVATDRAEFGARALGNRSIIADPRSFDTIRKINYQIKNRDFWMPFTPSILDKVADKYLINPKGNHLPYMSVACETTIQARRDIPAALHPADHTARPQIVSQDANPRYYDLIDRFGDITGVYALLNTSLNLHGFPIAQSAADALYVMRNSMLDGIFIGDTLFERID